MVFPGGFVCAKNALIALNAFYIFVAIILIISGAYAKAASIIPTLSIAGSIIAPGVCLLMVAILGAFGGVKHHQVALFFYMIVLFVVFLVQFFVAIACLAISNQHIKRGLEHGWQIASNETKCFAERSFDCCHFGEYKSPICPTVSFTFCAMYPIHWQCTTDKDICNEKFFHAAHDSLHTAGGLGLFFSFTEIIGIWLAMRFRNLKDPRANPNLFL
uniref:Tetraspanin-31 n=1 Tax=Romanomermis culicivorax TaxID=13658 RepID=A0A915KXB4_ROMCU